MRQNLKSPNVKPNLWTRVEFKSPWNRSKGEEGAVARAELCRVAVIKKGVSGFHWLTVWVEMLLMAHTLQAENDVKGGQSKRSGWGSNPGSKMYWSRIRGREAKGDKSLVFDSKWRESTCKCQLLEEKNLRSIILPAFAIHQGPSVVTFVFRWLTCLPVFCECADLSTIYFTIYQLCMYPLQEVHSRNDTKSLGPCPQQMPKSAVPSLATRQVER